MCRTVVTEEQRYVKISVVCYATKITLQSFLKLDIYSLNMVILQHH